MYEIKELVFDVEDLAREAECINATLNAVMSELETNMSESGSAILWGISVNINNLNHGLQLVKEQGFKLIKNG